MVVRNISGRLPRGWPETLRSVELLALVLATPLLLFPRGLLPWLAIGLMLSVWVVRGLVIGWWPPRTTLDRPLLALLLMLFVSLYASTDLSLSLPKFYGIVLGLFVYYGVAANVANGRHFWIVVGVLAAAIFSVSLLSLIGTEWNGRFAPLAGVYAHLPRLITEVQASQWTTAGFNPNQVGGTLALLLPLPLALLLGSPLSWRQRAAVGAVFLLGLAVFTLAFSRSALMGMGAAAVAILIWRWRPVGFAALIACGIALGAALLLGPQTVTDWLLSIDAASRSSGTASLPFRIKLWQQALKMIQDFPFTGIGLNTFPLVLESAYPISWATQINRMPHAHNIYLQTALDFGIGGFLAFTGLWGCAAQAAWKAVQQAGGNNRDERARQAAIVGLMAGLLAYLVAGLTDAITLGAKPTVLLWLMLATIVASARGAEAHRGKARATPNASHKCTGSRFVFQLSRLASSVGTVYWGITFLLIGAAYLAAFVELSGWIP